MTEFADHFGLVEMLPVGTARLGRVARIYSGGTPDKSRLDFWEGGSVPWIGSGEVNQWDVENPTALITDEAVRSSSTKLMPKGSLIMALAGQGKTKGMVARLAIDAYGNQSLACIAGYRGDERFLRWWLSGLYRDIRALSSQETRDGLNQSMLGRLPVPLFDLDTQKAIADFLDKETARIDQLIEKKQRLVELLGEREQALIFSLVVGTAHRSPRKAGLKWVPSVPTGWEVVPVKRVALLESGHTPNRSVGAYWQDADIPWVSLADSKQLRTTDYISETKHMITAAGLAGSSARILPKGTVVFTRDATVGLAAIAGRDLCVSQHLVGWVPAPTLRAEYLLHVIYAMRAELERLTWGATIKTIGMPDLRGLVTPLPPIHEQDQIVSRLKAGRSRLGRSRDLTSQSIDHLREYRSALITAAVTGQIDVTRWGQTGEGDKCLDQIQEEMAG